MKYIYLGVHTFTILMNGVSYMVFDMEVFCNILMNIVTFSGVVANKNFLHYIYLSVHTIIIHNRRFLEDYSTIFTKVVTGNGVVAHTIPTL